MRARPDRGYATAWWAGLTGEITAADPLRIAWDFNYGSVSHDKTSWLNRSGWFLNLLAEYKLDLGVPGLYVWWGSGDSGDVKNGSGRMPVISINNTNMMLSTFGFNGEYYSGVADGQPLGQGYTGTWGIGARIRDMSFIEDLKHTIRVNFFNGTNDPAMAKYITGKKDPGFGRQMARNFNDYSLSAATGGSGAGTYLTTLDYGLEVNLESIYKIYENLDVMFNLGYIHLWLDQSRGMWGAGWQNGVVGGTSVRGINYTDAIKANLIFRYNF